MTKRDGTITIKDATSSPISCTVQYEDGTMSIEGLTKGGFADLSFKDRGVTYSLRDGDDHEVTFSFDAHLLEITDASRKTISDAFLKTGAFSAGVSTWGTNTSDRWAVTVTFAIEGTDRGGDDEVITMLYCSGEVSWAEGEPSKISIKGKAYPKDSTLAVTYA